MINRNQQKGMTTIAWVLVFLIGAFFVMLALVLLPIYLENFKVRSHLSGLQDDKTFTALPEDQMIEALFKRFDIDDIDGVKPDDVEVIETPEGDTLSVEYNVQKPVFGNIEIVVFFTESIKLER